MWPSPRKPTNKEKAHTLLPQAKRLSDRRLPTLDLIKRFPQALCTRMLSAEPASRSAQAQVFEDGAWRPAEDSAGHHRLGGRDARPAPAAARQRRLHLGTRGADSSSDDAGSPEATGLQHGR